MDIPAIKKEMLNIGKKLYQRKLIVANQGNFSVRLDKNCVLATSKGVCKGELSLEDLVIIDIQGNLLQGKQPVSTEILMHLEVYQQRPDTKTVIHAHPPYCLALMLAGKKLDKAFSAESIIVLGNVPLVSYTTPSTEQLAKSIRPWITRTDCLLLDHHGSLTIGKTLKEAFYKLETMEHTAKIYLLATTTLAQVKEIDQTEITQLMKLRKDTYKIEWPIISLENSDKSA